MTEHELRKCQGRKWLTRVASSEVEPSKPVAFPQGIFGNARHLTADTHGGLWVLAYGEGLWHVNATGQVTRLTESEGLPNKRIECLFEDREGNIWLGLNGGGLACVRVRAFHTVWPAGGMPGLAAHTVCEDQSGAMWLGTSENMLLRWRNGEFTNYHPPINQTAGWDLTTFPDREGFLWVGSSHNGVLTLKNGEFSRPFSSTEIGTVARVIYQDQSGRIWIGSEFGLFCWEGNRLKQFTAADGFPTAYVLAITEDTAGNLWIGTGIGELWRYCDGKFTNYRPLDTPTSVESFAAAAQADTLQHRGRGVLTGGERFWALHADGDGVIWIGTLGGGLLRFEQGKFTRYALGSGLPNEHVSQILEDQRGQLWLGMRGGIARVSKAELNKFARGEINFVSFVSYGKSDGLPATECSGGGQPSSWRASDGHLWFATVKGAVWVNPDEVRMNVLPPPVVIEDFSVDGQSQRENSSTRLRVPAGRHYLDFKFTATSLTSPDKVRFKWRLAGLEKTWVNETSRRSVSYSFVPPGGYEFQVIACNNDGIWNQVGAAIKLIVLPYFWQTWWFKVLLILAVAGFSAAIYWFRISRLRSLQRLRLSIARDLHDEVGANLASISLLAQEIRKRPSSDDANEVLETSMETTDALRDIVWFIDPHHDRLNDLVARLNDIARNMLRNFDFQFEQSGDFNLAKLPLMFRRNVPPMFKEALHNILKHSQATKVHIRVNRREDQFQFQISDNGMGFDEKVVPAGNGLRNMRRRAEEIGGSLEINRNNDCGTTIILTAPIPKTRYWQ